VRQGRANSTKELHLNTMRIGSLARLGSLAGLIALLVSFCAPPSAQAQTSGTVAISGTVTAAVKLTSGGAATLTGNSGGGVTTSSGADAALATVVDFGDVGPGNTSAYVCFTQPLFLRANAPSTVSAAVTAESFGGGGGDLAKTDIGIGFQNLAAGGVLSTIVNTSITAAFSSDVCSAPIDADGVPTFSATLNDLATAAPGTAVIASTAAISLGGSFNSPNNEADIDLKLAIVPQAFTAGSFSATVTFTMTTP